MKTARPLSTGACESAAGATWREAPEGRSAFLWTIAAATALIVASGYGDTAAFIPGVAALFMAVRRFLTTRRLLAVRLNLAGRAATLTSVEDFAAQHTQKARKGVVWFGLGFDWTPEHAQKLYELSKIDSRRLIPSFWKRAPLLLRTPKGKPPEAIGLAALHGVGSVEYGLTVTEKTLEGGTLLVGTTQAGKGVMLNVLVTQAILKGDPVIVLDPKNSDRLKRTLFEAARLAERDKPLVFDPAHPDRGVRLNPLASFSRPSELAGRITAVITEEGPFKAFAWSAIHAAASLMVWTGEDPSLASLKAVMQKGLGDLLISAITREAGADKAKAWRQRAAELKCNGRDEILCLLGCREDEGFTDPVIDAAAAVFRHDPAHYEKITASLMPVLEMLTSGPLLTALSPSVVTKNAADPRAAVSLKTVIANRGILYVALDALPDPQLAGAVGSILLADLASLAGERYRESDRPSRVALFVDECSNVINRPLIEILNKGAESGIRTTCAMQTVSDLAARLGSDAAARMALGNFNNLIALRTKDRTTQEFVAESFGKTYIASTEAALTSSSKTGPAGEFSAGVTRRMTSVREDIIPEDALGKLPNCEFFASLAGGRLVKGRVPILIVDKESS